VATPSARALLAAPLAPTAPGGAQDGDEDAAPTGAGPTGASTAVAFDAVDAEHALVGCLLIDPEYAAPHVKRLQPADFTDPMARAFFQAGASAHSDPIALSTRAAQATGHPVSRTLAYASAQMATVPSAMSVEMYVELILEAAERRRGLAVISQAGAALMRGQSWNEVSLWIAGRLRERRTAAQDRPMPAVVADVYTRVEAWLADPLADGQVRYLTTGYPELNRLTGGLRPALVLCGARPSVGKTSLWSQVAVRAAGTLPLRGSDVLYFTNEMTDVQLATRLCCSMAGVSVIELERGRLSEAQMLRVFEAMDALQALPLRLIYARTLGAIVSRCYQAEHPALIIIDYLNKLSGGKGENRNQEYGAIASTLFDMAYDLQTPVVLLCQLNRDLTKRGRDALPEMEDLRDSGELEQIADVILLLHRTEAAPEELRVLKRKDRLGGGQHDGISLSFGPLAQVGDWG
jgi:replicative DNA helicase